MKLWQQYVRKQYKEMQDEIYTLLQERREQVVLEDYMKPEHIKHLQLFEYQVKHLTTFKEIPENVEITMRKEAAGDEADEEEITEYDVLMRVKINPLTDEPMMEMKRIEKMDIEQAKREMEVPQTDYVARMIGQAHRILISACRVCIDSTLAPPQQCLTGRLIRRGSAPVLGNTGSSRYVLVMKLQALILSVTSM